MRWDGAENLYDMMGLKSDDENYSLLSRYIPDYHINLVDAGRIVDTDRFHSDLHEVLGMLKYREDKVGLQKYIKNHGSLNMCKAIEDLYEDGIEKGIVQGKRDTALNLKKMGMAAEQIAQAVGETAAIVGEWLSEANAAK